MPSPIAEVKVLLVTDHQWAIGEALQAYPHESREKDGLMTALLIDGPTDAYVIMTPAQIDFICGPLATWARASLPDQGSKGRNEMALQFWNEIESVIRK